MEKVVTDASFSADVLEAHGAVLVDFWAPWCGPCKQMAPGLSALAEQRQDVTVAKVNIDDNPGSPVRFGVRGVPTLMVFRDGKVIGTRVGSMTPGVLAQWLDGMLAEDAGRS